MPPFPKTFAPSLSLRGAGVSDIFSVSAHELQARKISTPVAVGGPFPVALTCRGRENRREALCAKLIPLNQVSNTFSFSSQITRGIARSLVNGTVDCTPLQLTRKSIDIRSSFVICDAIIGRREKQLAIATLFARESPKECIAKWGAAAPPLFSLPPPSFETVTHFATGKHLSDALLPPPPSPSPERKNGNTLIQSGVTKRPFLEAENRAIKASPPILAALKDCRKLPDNPSCEMYGNKYILQEISMPRRTT